MSQFLQSLAIGALGAGGGAGSFFAYLRAKDARKSEVVLDSGKLELSSRRVESEAYANSVKINEDIVSGLRQELDRVRRDLATERDGRAEDNRRHAGELEALRTELSQLWARLNGPLKGNDS